jgi:hypothetical protein
LNYNQIINYVANGLLQRGNNLDLSTAAISSVPLANANTTDMTGTVAAQLVSAAHLDLQRGIYTEPRTGEVKVHDWQCQDLPWKTNYQAGGLQVEETVKRIYAVYDQHVDTTTGTVQRGAEYWPITQDVREDVRLRGDRSLRFGYRGDGIDLSSGVDYGGGGRGGFRGRYWWQQGGQLYVGDHNRCETTAGGTPALPNLWIDTYSLLPGLQSPNDTDWFTLWGWECIAYGAALRGSIIGQESDGNQALFAAEHLKEFAKLMRLDQRNRAGGTAGVARAPQQHFSTQR